MIQRIIFGLIWAAVIYFVGCALVGGVAGGIAGAQANPADAGIAGARAGAEAVAAYRPYIGLGALITAAVGSSLGALPGTRIAKAGETEPGHRHES